jgi:hypothetical protein
MLASRAAYTAHCKKRLATFPSPAGMTLTELLFPLRESLVSVIPAGDGNVTILFLRCRKIESAMAIFSKSKEKHVSQKVTFNLFIICDFANLGFACMIQIHHWYLPAFAVTRLHIFFKSINCDALLFIEFLSDVNKSGDCSIMIASFTKP